MFSIAIFSKVEPFVLKNVYTKMIEKQGDLLTASEDYIVQQCCCTACRPHGLSDAIASAFPHGNAYALRKPVAPRRNTAREEDRPEPGTSLILGNGTSQRYIVCLFGQMAMGKPGRYEAFGTSDSAEDRELYFQQSLEHLSTQIPAKCSLAFPYKIGCGLAGGDWNKYKTMLKKWEQQNMGYTVVLYKL